MKSSTPHTRAYRLRRLAEDADAYRAQMAAYQRARRARLKQEKADGRLRGKIYAIRNHINDEVYVGSTGNDLGRRMGNHRQRCRKLAGKGNRLHTLMFELGPSAFYIEVLEDYPCSSAAELRMKESKWIERVGN